MSDVVEDHRRSSDIRKDAGDKTLSTKERFYSGAIFLIFIICFLGFWKRYAIAVGVALGLLLILFHFIFQKYTKTDDVEADIGVIDTTTDVCHTDEKEDIIGIVCVGNERILTTLGTRDASSVHRSGLPSVTDVEIASHYFHRLDSITEVLQESQVDEGIGNDAYEIDVDDVTHSGSSPPNYTDVRHVIYTGLLQTHFL
ncbi:uncharacterized protein LOC117104854 [Anneissia japonica]|uniref:uncharacterized protein LOC117104854 n=1 Tax=Anneissia japonica TaxID=1529436 RepID=UPI0014255966|nr:uncharacterized protein LOC117104854 [Anneissia japonica]